MAVFKSKLFLKIYFSYILILVLPILILGGVSYQNTKQIVDGQLSQVNRTSVEKVKEAFDQVFKDIEKTIYLIGKNPWLRNILISENIGERNNVDSLEYSYVIAQLRSYRVSNNLIKAVSVVSKTGSIAIDADSMYDGDYFFTTRYQFDSAAFRGFDDINWNDKRPKVVIDARVTPYSMPGEAAMLYIRNIPIDSPFTGVVIIQINPSRLMQVLNQYNTDENTRLIMLNEKNEPILTNGDSGDLAAAEPIFRDGLLESGTLTVGNRSYNYFGTTSAFNRYKYVAVVDTKSLMAQINKIRSMTLSLVVASLMLGCAISYFAAVNNYRPIRKLADKLSFGPYRKEKSVNEISLIEQAFQHYRLEKATLIKEIEAHLPIVRNNALIKLVSGSLGADVEEELKQNGIVFKYKYYIVGIMYVEAAEMTASPGADAHAALSAFVRKSIEEYFQAAQAYCCYVVEMNNFEYTMIVNSETDADDRLRNILEQIIQNIKALLIERADCAVAVGVGTMQQSLFDLVNSSIEARKAMPHRFATLNSEILYYKDLKDNIKNTFEYSLETELQLINILKTGDIAQIDDYLNKILERNFQRKNMNANSARYLFHELQAAAMKVMIEYHSDKLDIVDYREMDGKHINYQQLVSHIKQIYRQVCDIVNSSRADEGVIADIVDFIDGNYQNCKMSLKFLSDNFNISGVYISRLFKQHTGLNFIDYLHKKRIEQAKVLLNDPHLLVKDIAGMVGYDNDRNFHRVFKKIEAISPSDYRANRHRR